MKITKRQLKAALTVAYEAGFDGKRGPQHSPTDTVKRIAKHEAEHAKARKLKNVRKHWNVAADYVVNLRGELGAGKSVPVREQKALHRLLLEERKQVKLPYKPVMEIGDSWDSNTLSDLLAEYEFEGQKFLDDYPRAVAAAQLELGELYLDSTSTTSDNNESNASKLNETPTKEDV